MSQILLATASPRLCPQLATPNPIVITKDNVDSLSLSNYNRTQGTTVNVSCLATPQYKVVGATTLTCLNTGQWDRPIPRCEIDSPTPGGDRAVGQWDISMMPVLVAAATAGVILLAVVCIMLIVLLCSSRWQCHGRRVHKAPIGLLRSMSLQEAASVFTQRRHRYYAASESSDVIDSVSTRCPPYTHIHSLPVHDKPPYTYHIRASRSERAPSMLSLDQSDNLSRSLPTTYYTARSKGTEPTLKTRVGTGESYRTWQELFFPPYS